MCFNVCVCIYDTSGQWYNLGNWVGIWYARTMEWVLWVDKKIKDHEDGEEGPKTERRGDIDIDIIM